MGGSPYPWQWLAWEEVQGPWVKSKVILSSYSDTEAMVADNYPESAFLI